MVDRWKMENGCAYINSGGGWILLEDYETSVFKEYLDYLGDK